jgi:hypothetical protein
MMMKVAQNATESGGMRRQSDRTTVTHKLVLVVVPMIVASDRFWNWSIYSRIKCGFFGSSTAM